MQRDMTVKDYNKLGMLQFNQGNYYLAISNFSEAIRLDPNNAIAYNNRGIAHQKQGNYPLAMQDYEQALRLDPNYATAYNNLGSIYQDQGCYNLAIQNYNEALRLDPNYATAYSNRGISYKQKGKLREASFNFIQALTIDPNNDAPFNTELKKALKDLSKSQLLNTIKELPDEKQIPLLIQCLDENTVLGERFWKKEGFFACSIESGTLKQINNHLSDLCRPATTWIFLVGPELVRNNTLLADTFFHITSHFLQVKLNLPTTTFYKSLYNTIFQPPVKKAEKNNMNVNEEKSRAIIKKPSK